MIRQIVYTFLFIFLCSSTLYPQAYKLNSVYFVNNNVGWAAGLGGTILKTTNAGLSWIPQHVSYLVDLYSVYFVDHNIGFVVGFQWGDYAVGKKTTNGGNDWYGVVPVEFYPLNSVQFIDQSIGWAVGVGTILKTTDVGENWTEQTNGTPYLSSVCFIDNNIGWVVGGEGTILKTTNGGTDWIFQTSGISNTLTSVYFTDQNTGWIVGDTGTILKTLDGGASWKADSSGVGSTLRSIFFIDENTGWIVGDYGIILNTKDSGNNWSIQTSGTTDQLNSVHFEDYNFGWAVGGSYPEHYATILHTSNGGEDWKTQIISDIDVEEREDNNIPTNYSLNQNYPNPFNPVTTIKYQIPEISIVTIKVYDVLGKEVATLVNEEKPIGNYEVEFNSHSGLVRNLPSGIYFYQIKAGNFIETKKMVLLK